MSRQRSGCWVSARTSAPDRARMRRRSARRDRRRWRAAANSRSHSAMLKVACLPPMKQTVRTPWAWLSVERQQQQRPAFGVVGDHDEGRKAGARSDLPLPGAEKVESLIRCGELAPIFEAAPDRLGLNEIVKDIDAGDAARFRPRGCFRRPVFDRGSHGHLRNLSTGKYLHFSDSADLCKEMSTKSNDNAARRGGYIRGVGTRRCHPRTLF